MSIVITINGIYFIKACSSLILASFFSMLQHLVKDEDHLRHVQHSKRRQRVGTGLPASAARQLHANGGRLAEEPVPAVPGVHLICLSLMY